MTDTGARGNDFTNEFVVAESGGAASPEDSEKAGDEIELDAHRIAQRQKQVDYGKNTLGYQMYLKMMPKERRKLKDPSTPDAMQKISKRCFDGQVKSWRRQLHQYDQIAQQTLPSGRGRGASQGDKSDKGKKTIPGQKRLFQESFPPKTPGGTANPNPEQQSKRFSGQAPSHAYDQLKDISALVANKLNAMASPAPQGLSSTTPANTPLKASSPGKAGLGDLDEETIETDIEAEIAVHGMESDNILALCLGKGAVRVESWADAAEEEDDIGDVQI